ncbi:hypothetical protein ACLB2K_052716 [Fragaria x ananassa]
MATMMVFGRGAAMASMTAHLISNLSLRQEDELVDLENIKRHGMGFVAPRFYLVGKLNFTRAVQFDFLSKCSTSDAELVGKTIGPVLNIDQSGLMIGSTRVSVTLPLNNLVCIDRCLHVSLEDVIKVQYRYERLVSLCRDCMMLNHGGMVCPKAQEAMEETEDLNGPVSVAIPFHVVHVKDDRSIVAAPRLLLVLSSIFSSALGCCCKCLLFSWRI